MNALIRLVRTEPTAVVTFILAVVGLLGAFGLTLSDHQTAAISAVVQAVLVLMGGGVIRSQVTPAATSATQDVEEDVPDNPLTDDAD